MCLLPQTLLDGVDVLEGDVTRSRLDATVLPLDWGAVARDLDLGELARSRAYEIYLVAQRRGGTTATTMTAHVEGDRTLLEDLVHGATVLHRDLLGRRQHEVRRDLFVAGLSTVSAVGEFDQLALALVHFELVRSGDGDLVVDVLRRSLYGTALPLAGESAIGAEVVAV